MTQTYLSDFLEVKDGNILLPIDDFLFSLSEKSANNMVVALMGALNRMGKRVNEASRRPKEDQTTQFTAWREVFYLCLSLGMRTTNKTGLESVKSFIVELAKCTKENDELKCVLCGKGLHEYETHCLVV